MSLKRRRLICSAVTLAASIACFCPAEEMGFIYEQIAPNLVIIEFERNFEPCRALGVVAEMDGTPYLLTNQHILLGASQLKFTTAESERLYPRSVELSTTRDLARLSLSEETTFSTLKITENKVRMNEIITLATDESGEDERLMEGTVIGIGGIKFEISMEISEEHNGAPVLNEAGEIVGIASYSQQPNKSVWKKDTRFDVDSRNFCYRISDKGWKRVNWKKYNRQFGVPYLEHKELEDRLITLFKDKDAWPISIRKAEELAAECKTHFRKIEVEIERPGMTAFLTTELENYAELFQFAEELFSDYAAAR